MLCLFIDTRRNQSAHKELVSWKKTIASLQNFVSFYTVHWGHTEHKHWFLLGTSINSMSKHDNRFLHNHGNIATKGSLSRDYALLLFRMISRVLYSAQYHRQHCTLHAFEQFGALYMHNHDDKYLSQPRFEPGTPMLQAPVKFRHFQGFQTPVWITLCGIFAAYNKWYLICYHTLVDELTCWDVDNLYYVIY